MHMQDRLSSRGPVMTKWRHHLHSRPEMAFEEYETATFISDVLDSLGIAVHRGLGKTGVVGTLDRGASSGGTIGLRADMDALPVTEENIFGHRSRHPGIMHACGHDGHMAMLLGAASLLAEEGRFNGRVHFIFQPAEEHAGGAQVMIDDGLFDRFPCEAVFGMHTFPALPFGVFALRAGPMMAACDSFTIHVMGTGGHAAMPHLLKDPVHAAAHLVTQLQSIVSRNVDPIAPAVVSVTRIQGGTNFNVIPARVTLQGTARHFEPAVQDLVEARITEVADGIARSHGVDVEVSYERRYPPLVNTARETDRAARAAMRVVGDESVRLDIPPVMGSEDFACMLRQCPGAYIGLGGGETRPDRQLHQAGYDFNDGLLPIGAAYWVSLVEDLLADAAAEGNRNR